MCVIVSYIAFELHMSQRHYRMHQLVFYMFVLVPHASVRAAINHLVSVFTLSAAIADATVVAGMFV